MFLKFSGLGFKGSQIFNIRAAEAEIKNSVGQAPARTT